MASKIKTLMTPSKIIRDIELNMKLKLKGHGSTLKET